MDDVVNKNAHCAQTKVHGLGRGRLRVVQPEEIPVTEQDVIRHNKAASGALDAKEAEAEKKAAEIFKPFADLSETLAPYVALKIALDAALGQPRGRAPAIRAAMDAFEGATSGSAHLSREQRLEGALQSAVHALDAE